LRHGKKYQKTEDRILQYLESRRALIEPFENDNSTSNGKTHGSRKVKARWTLGCANTEQSGATDYKPSP
jgi:hypothetical protein